MNAPMLRFKGFRDGWKLNPISEVANINPKSHGLPNTFIYIDLESVESGKLLFKNIINKDNAPSRAQRLLKHNDILVQTVRPYQQNHFLFRNLEIDSVASTGYALLRTKKEIEPAFVYQLFFTERVNFEINKRCTGTSYPAISSSDLSDILIYTPDTFEQKKVASFFSKLDKKILLQQEKIDLLKQQKKGFMQKIFSQELRFKDEHGQEFPEWRKIKLSNFASKITKKNKDISVTNVISNSAKQGLISQRNFFDKDIANQDNIDGYYVISYGDFVYNPRISSDAPYGPVNIFNDTEQGIVSPLYMCFKVKNINQRFLYHYFQGTLWHKYIYLHGDSGARHDRVSIKDSTFLELPILVPSMAEQNLIADFLNQLQNKVDEEEKKLEALQTQKQAFMQQMFI